eukprot:CAMPEP_0114610048 /NCGR_PEP_ID=MMETSP0168-20121206/3399_1 /TAXON_ID=95228 ORGANISM="Vannella sp., Strain DIVA3 517/6/12" /NCGR_SAMPLE_ID=MMETSP0168 /ASSEMBLY_ACC=CAM_ASM_000044 /LENGTH=182 /DNA_ID=CAMNT_0001820977 /DNA_START=42 /DNA_END=590 /DNA_ORIENTATION=-
MFALLLSHASPWEALHELGKPEVRAPVRERAMRQSLVPNDETVGTAWDALNEAIQRVSALNRERYGVLFNAVLIETGVYVVTGPLFEELVEPWHAHEAAIFLLVISQVETALEVDMTTVYLVVLADEVTNITPVCEAVEAIGPGAQVEMIIRLRHTSIVHSAHVHGGPIDAGSIVANDELFR